jgi:hypothetical protein
MKFEAVEPAIAGGQVDLVLANTSSYVELEKTQGVKAILTIANLQDGKSMTQFGDVILVKADSAIKSLTDIKGKKFMVTERSSFGRGTGLRHPGNQRRDRTDRPRDGGQLRQRREVGNCQSRNDLAGRRPPGDD